jgi:sulfur relay protein TusB/DsrH
MGTLYLLTKSPWARREMSEWLPRVGEKDALLLIQDAVIALQSAPPDVARQLERMGPRLFALEADLAARAIEGKGAGVVDDGAALELLARFDRIVAI